MLSRSKSNPEARATKAKRGSMANLTTEAEKTRLATRLAGSVRPIRKAHEQIADQIRALIVNGQIGPGERLPSETALAAQFGASRATVREALRGLASQNLIRTSRGTAGGSFVTRPSPEHISEFLSTNFSLLSQTDDVTVAQFLEARALLEVPAALIAIRREDAWLEALRKEVPDTPLRVDRDEQIIHNSNFHMALVLAAGNPLLSISMQSILFVLQAHLKRSTLGIDYQERVVCEHRAILSALESQDEKRVETHSATISSSCDLTTSTPGPPATAR